MILAVFTLCAASPWAMGSAWRTSSRTLSAMADAFFSARTAGLANVAGAALDMGAAAGAGAEYCAGLAGGASKRCCASSWVRKVRLRPMPRVAKPATATAQRCRPPAPNSQVCRRPARDGRGSGQFRVAWAAAAARMRSSSAVEGSSWQWRR
ncbi:hypothetical protein D3C84_915350 [compost metagenome]